MDNTFVLLYRSFLDDGRIVGDSEFVSVYVFLLLKAQYQKIEMRGHVLEIGELDTTQSQMSDKLNIKVSRVKYIIKRLREFKKISVRKAGRVSIIKLVNFENYQGKKKSSPVIADDNLGTNEGKNMNKTNVVQEDKKIKKAQEKREEVAMITEEFNDHFWPMYPNRNGKKKALETYLKHRAGNKNSQFDIMTGVENYVEHLKTVDYSSRMAQGWLNDERWNDEYSKPNSKQNVAPVSYAV